MKPRTLARRLGLAGAAGITLAAAAAGMAAGTTGPSTTTAPYLVPSAPGVSLTSVLTVGDAVGTKPDGSPYRMVGLPDGLGAYDNHDGTFTVLMNQELGSTAGVVRAHGATGAFVSKWTIDKKTLKVLKGEDLVQQISVFDPVAEVWKAAAKGVAMSRLCSADLPAMSAFWDRQSGLGYRGRLFMDGEETGNEGRAFAHALDGTSWELPHLGKFSWENSVAKPDSGRRTVVVGLDDSTPGQVYVYIGRKQRSGSPIEQAGLVGGQLYGVKVPGVRDERTDAVGGIPSGTPFQLRGLGDVSADTAAQLQALSVQRKVTEFNRPEDGVWDARTGDFYFVTTASFSGTSRLWRLRFANPNRPQDGGQIDMLLDGTEGQKMMDNMTIQGSSLFIQEDVGNNPRLGKIWRYDIPTDTLTEVAQHDPAVFTSGQPGFLTEDEESSGIIDVSSILGPGKLLLDVQVHKANADPELVEGGQLVVLDTKPGRPRWDRPWGGDDDHHHDR